jgi:MoaA/NifB/PqqE/SkfB family radical SAM enzyme
MMNLDQLKEKYDVVCFEDLADYYSRHRAIFDLFKKYYQKEFLGNQRLVLYSSEYLSQEFINHIQRAASQIDISNFFILILTPVDISSKLQEASQKYGHDNILINFEITDIGSSRPFGPAGFVKNYESMCVFPFIQQSVFNTATVRVCCKMSTSVGNLQNNTLHEIFNNDKSTSIRQRLANGEMIKECNVCWDAEKNNLSSLRQHGLTKFRNQLDQGWFDDVKPRTIDVSPVSLCNFSCRICNPGASSSIAVEELRYETNENNKKRLKQLININKSDFNKSIPSRLIDSMADVEFLHIMGGEPFMWPQLEELLDLLVKKDIAKNIQLEFNSNGSIYPNATIIDKLKKFKQVEILLSIDDIEKRFEIQRSGIWNDVYKNIELFRNLKSSTFNVKAAITVNIQNVLYLDQVVEFFQNLNFGIVWWYLDRPEYLSIHNTTKKVKNLIYQKYHSHADPELRSIATSVQSSRPVSGKEFLEYTLKLDGRRGQDFKLYHSELFNAMSD